MSRPIRQVGFKSLASYAATEFAASENIDVDVPIEAIGCVLHLEAGDDAGTNPTLDVKLQEKNRVTGTYIDIPGASFAQVTTSNVTKRLVVYPGIAETANESVSDVIAGKDLRVVATLGGTNVPTYRLQLGIVWLG